jgi:hypothetical protein
MTRRKHSAEPVPDDLAALVAAGVIPTYLATTMAKTRRASVARAAETAAEAAAASARREERDRMAPAWARSVLVHGPGWADMVLQGLPLGEAVAFIREWNGCDPATCHHQPLTDEERHALALAMIEADARAAPPTAP